MESKDFAVFILSHGRADTISTYKALRDGGYTGRTYVVIDNEDDQEELYRQKFGDDIIQFDKRDYLEKTDLGDLDTDRRIGVFARNFIQDEAKRLGYKFHLQLDDDVHGFTYRFAQGKVLRALHCSHLDEVFSGMVEYMKETPITSLSFALSAYNMGGVDGSIKEGMTRKTMTTFLMRADDVQYFHMRMNDDITTSLINGMRGKLYYSYLPIEVEVDKTQVKAGGMTDIYQKNGTYRKSFYSVMCCPSCVKVSAMGITDYRIHHTISWNNAVPKLLSERWCKHERH
nr:MAG TPA: hypothetical protein [Caudoviricetes sp.]